MSDNAKNLWQTITGDVKAELSRLGTQGAMELASALFNGSGFVPYGPGAYTPDVEQEKAQQQELGLEREGR